MTTEKNTKSTTYKTIGNCNNVKRVVEKASIIAKSKLPVLICGETGTGKERLANDIHTLSGRLGDFVPVNCSGLPVQLMESILFGHKKGAFTGANADQDGVIKRAEGGTLFLDEITDMPFEIQSKLLRFLEDFSYWPLGYVGKPLKADVRIITATNSNIKRLIKERKFREDLYYRIVGDILVIPPLRERKPDIKLLVDSIIGELDESKKCKLGDLEHKLLTSFNWPGNIRQLRMFLHKCLVYNSTGRAMKKLIKEEVELETLLLGSDSEFLPTTFEEAEIYVIKKALTLSQGNKSKAVRILRAAPNTLSNKLKKYKIDSNLY